MSLLRNILRVVVSRTSLEKVAFGLLGNPLLLSISLHPLRIALYLYSSRGRPGGFLALLFVGVLSELEVKNI